MSKTIKFIDQRAPETTCYLFVHSKKMLSIHFLKKKKTKLKINEKIIGKMYSTYMKWKTKKIIKCSKTELIKWKYKYLLTPTHPQQLLFVALDFSSSVLPLYDQSLFEVLEYFSQRPCLEFLVFHLVLLISHLQLQGVKQVLQISK